MNIQMEAVDENEVFRPLQPVALAEHQRVTVVMDAEAPSTTLPLHPDLPRSERTKAAPSV
jgi:predicted DNA-binding antitoxin AbrB/MazE fold protein